MWLWAKIDCYPVLSFFKEVINNKCTCQQQSLSHILNLIGAMSTQYTFGISHRYHFDSSTNIILSLGSYHMLNVDRRIPMIIHYFSLLLLPIKKWHGLHGIHLMFTNLYLFKNRISNILCLHVYSVRVASNHKIWYTMQHILQMCNERMKHAGEWSCTLYIHGAFHPFHLLFNEHM
jgi:hypothetical protein